MTKWAAGTAGMPKSAENEELLSPHSSQRTISVPLFLCGIHCPPSHCTRFPDLICFSRPRTGTRELA